MDAKDRYFRDNLVKYYPSGLCKNIRYDYTDLYIELLEYLNGTSTTISDYLKSLGFVLVQPNSHKEISKVSLSEFDKELYIIRAKLSDMYPDGIIIELSKRNRVLYNDMYNLSKKCEVTLDELVSYIGFKRPPRNEDEVVKKALLKLYPDGKVSRLSVKDNALYCKAKDRCRTLGISLAEYITRLGLKHLSKAEVSRLEQVDTLRKLYPNGKVTLLRSLDRSLYVKLNNSAKANGLTLEQYISLLGFEYSK